MRTRITPNTDTFRAVKWKNGLIFGTVWKWTSFFHIINPVDCASSNTKTVLTQNLIRVTIWKFKNATNSNSMFLQRVTYLKIICSRLEIKALDFMLQLGPNALKVNEKDTKSKSINVVLVCSLLFENKFRTVFRKSIYSFYF